MTTESFIFSQLNFNGDEYQAEQGKSQKTESDELSSANIPKNRPITMSLFVPPGVIARPNFDASKYILTPKGYIHATIFPQSTPKTLENLHFLEAFPQPLVNDAVRIILESLNVLNFVLDQLLQLPCNVPIRWGVLFNLKFRRVFQCLTLDKWTGLYEVLKRHGYAKMSKGNVLLVDPSFEAPETINLDENFEQLLNSSNIKDSASEVRIEDCDQNNLKNIPATPTHKLPTDSLSFPQTPTKPILFELPIDSPAIVPVRRAKNNSIYAIHLSHSISPALADRFNPANFPPVLHNKIHEIYQHNATVLEAITNQLRQLPVGIPLRWGVIFNKHLRVRSQGRRELESSLDQWKQLKTLLATEGFLCDKSTANCVILINKLKP